MPDQTHGNQPEDPDDSTEPDGTEDEEKAKRHRRKSRFKRWAIRITGAVVLGGAGVIGQELARPYVAQAVEYVRQIL